MKENISNKMLLPNDNTNKSSLSEYENHFGLHKYNVPQSDLTSQKESIEAMAMKLSIEPSPQT